MLSTFDPWDFLPGGASSLPRPWTGLLSWGYSAARYSYGSSRAFWVGDVAWIHGFKLHPFLNGTQLCIYYQDPSLEFLAQKPNDQLHLTI